MRVVKEQAYGGYPSWFSNICQVRPITMGEFLKMGSTTYYTRLGLLLLTTPEIEDIIAEKGLNPEDYGDLRPLTYLLRNAEASDSFLLELESAFSTFIDEEILLLPKLNAVLVGSPEDKRLITNDNFEDFQTILRLQNRKVVPEPPPENESAIAKKMRLAREKREAVKRKQQQQNGEEQSLEDLLEIAEVFGIDYQDKSLYCFYGLLSRYQRKEKWDQDLHSLWAGGDPNNIKPEYWGLSKKD